jgi:hypothetical protein
MRRTLVLIALLCLAAPASALASPSQLIRDCTTHGTLTKQYSQKEYQQALAQLPSDIDEYTNCRDVIRRAMLAAAGSGGGGRHGGPGAGAGSGGGIVPLADPLETASPADRAAVEKAQTSGHLPLRIGDRLVTPGVSGFAARAARASLPAPMIAALAAAGAALLVALAAGTRRLVLARRAQP